MTIEAPSDEDVKAVYAHFGLAMYLAQVFEHEIINAMMFARIRDRDQLTRSEIDAFVQAQFARTLGQLLQELRRHIAVSSTHQGILREAMRRRNWLAHNYFRERAVEFMTLSGCAAMIAELQDARDLFAQASELLKGLAGEILAQLSIDEEAIAKRANEMLQNYQRDIATVE